MIYQQELFALLQPQAGATARTVDPPLTIGTVIDDADAGGPSVPQAMTW
ncbi:hypothetical protein ACSHWB_20120 [Lentzea sp. HUAS TT2]